MFKVSSSVYIYNASDKSGVLVFVQKLGKVVSLAHDIGSTLLYLKSVDSFDFALFRTEIIEFAPDQVENIWHTLVSEGILIEET